MKQNHFIRFTKIVIYYSTMPNRRK